MSNFNFDFSNFTGVKSGQKTTTSTPILVAKGSLNGFSINKPALDLMGVTNNNIYIMQNPTAPLGERFLACILPATDVAAGVTFPGAKIVTKDDNDNSSATFQYSPIWGQMMGDTTEIRSTQEMRHAGILVPYGKRYAGVKKIEFQVEMVAENVPFEQLAQYNPELVGLEGVTSIFSLVKPTVLPYEKRSIVRGVSYGN